MEHVFAEELAGHKLITNRSLWRQFPMIRCARWTQGNVVLLGDAKATAHFSIGSGTKLAMEDAIALHAAVMAGGSVADCLARFEHGRREAVEKIQHAADVSLVWFEHVRRFWPMHPTRFAFGVMTRSKAITYDDLALRAPDFVQEVDALFAREVAGNGEPAEATRPPMFQPFRLRGMRLANRVVVSPMCQYSAEDGLPTDWHLVHYGARATGGAGLIYTEMTCPSADARITPGCTGLWNDAQEAAWTRIVAFTHAHGAAKMCLQLGHAGRKGSTRLMWDAMDRPLQQGGWPIISASPIPYYPDSPVPRAMDRADMDRVVNDFRQAAERGERCGFDMLELHCAHGYLLASFLSPLTNTRTDEYGGTVENRLRFPLEVFDALRKIWPAEKPMSVRLSATDWADGGISEADVVDDRACLRGAWLRPVGCLHRADGSRRGAGLRADVPGAVLRHDPQRDRVGDDVRRVDHLGRPGEHDPGRRPRRSGRLGSAASGGSGVRHAGCGRLRRDRYRLPGAIRIRPRRTDAQCRSRTGRPDGPATSSEAA